MKTHFILISILALSFIACNSGKIEDTDHHAQKVMLNQGSKWQANPETTAGITKMKLLVDDFMKEDNKDCAALHSALVVEFESIIQQCTMTGEAHEQLHNFLIPLQENIVKTKGKTGEECEAAVKSVRDFLSTYDQYFV